MKFFILSLALLGTVLAELPSSEYLPPLEDASASNNVDLQTLADSSVLSDDGYRYKAVKRLRFRHRRDVSELPASEYLPPVAAASDAQPVADLPVVEAAAPAPAESAVLADDGYRYKVVKRYRLRHRRDVNELPSNEYLPPNESLAGPAPVEAAADVEAPVEDKPEESVAPAEAAAEPEAEPEAPVEAPAAPAVVEPEAEAESPAASSDSAVLADDGYHYKTVKRYRFRHRRDVNELPANEYLPPAGDAPAASEPEVVATPVEAEPEAPAAPAVAEAEAPAASSDSAVLADDGYRYKTVKRYRFRHRRDVNELPANEYLPPAGDAPAASEPEVAAAPVEAEPEPEVAEAEVAEAEAPAASSDSAVLADDGYRYKTVKRYRFRQRRDVSELPASEYLPPNSEASAPVALEASAPVPVESAPLSEDGYRYRTAKRVVYRHRH